MRFFYIIVFLSYIFYSCGSHKVTSSQKNRKTTISNKNSVNILEGKTIKAKGKANDVLQEAYSYLGTKYKFGGTTSSGIDCSGLVCNAFKVVDVQLPRRTMNQSNQGIFIDLKDLKPGDILFFNTSGKGISHSGIVESISNGEIFFIHTSTSKGVMISSLENTYWKPKYVTARRIIE